MYSHCWPFGYLNLCRGKLLHTDILKQSYSEVNNNSTYYPKSHFTGAECAHVIFKFVASPYIH